MDVLGNLVTKKVSTLQNPRSTKSPKIQRAFKCIHRNRRVSGQQTAWWTGNCREIIDIRGIVKNKVLTKWPTHPLLSPPSLLNGKRGFPYPSCPYKSIQTTYDSMATECELLLPMSQISTENLSSECRTLKVLLQSIINIHDEDGPANSLSSTLSASRDSSAAIETTLYNRKTRVAMGKRVIEVQTVHRQQHYLAYVRGFVGEGGVGGVRGGHWHVKGQGDTPAAPAYPHWDALSGRRHNQLQYSDDGDGLYGGKINVYNDGGGVDEIMDRLVEIGAVVGCGIRLYPPIETAGRKEAIKDVSQLPNPKLA
ncbi:hypothetical protein F5887DRAFT_922069 [Amanita rubescens]|nr:hypothetical protein F5887DRAFT_922069 [Amanita rubescens]